jgi:hypothetical protein
LVTPIDCWFGFAPPSAAAKLAAVAPSAIAGCGPTTVSVTVTAAGEFEASGETTSTAAVYVPGARLPWFTLSSSAAGAVEPDMLADSQPAWPAV